MKHQLLIALISFVTYSTQFNATCLNDYPNDENCVNAVELLFGSSEFIYYNKNGNIKVCSGEDVEGYPSNCGCYQDIYANLLCDLDSIITECPLDNYPDKKMHPVVETCTTETERNKLLEFQSTYETAIKKENCKLETNPTCLETKPSTQSQNQ